MDREGVLRISRLSAFGGLEEADILILLTNYCLEHNKDALNTQLFLTYLLGTPFITSCFQIALKWYEDKFTINKLYSKPNPYSVGDGRKILLIF